MPQYLRLCIDRRESAAQFNVERIEKLCIQAESFVTWPSGFRERTFVQRTEVKISNYRQQDQRKSQLNGIFSHFRQSEPIVFTDSAVS